MTDLITVLAVVAGIIWLGLMLVSALRNRGGREEVSHNLRPGTDDQQLETRTLEGGQKAAIAFSAFLAIALPLYFLTENARQEEFVGDFATASVERGQEYVESFGCFDCHGPLGAGGSASYVEPRSGVSVSWIVPSLDDIFYRYDAEEVTYWITYGRGKTPMPAWGLAGGGPMNEKQVQDIVHYLQTIQIPQQDVVNEIPEVIEAQKTRLENAEQTMQTAIIEQKQVVADIDQAADDIDAIGSLAEQASAILETAGQGIDTDADGVSDAAELNLSDISAQVVDYFTTLEPVTLDPATADADLLEEGLTALQAAAETDPILSLSVQRIEATLESDEISEESPDGDGDGISDAAETTISGIFTDASGATVPQGLSVIDLDPTNPQTTTGVPDLETAATMEGGLESVALNLGVTVENKKRIRSQQVGGLNFLLESAKEERWKVDFEGVAEAMGGTLEEAQRAVYLFSGYCGRCHSGSFSAGLPYAQGIGSGSLGPALWHGREVVQFGEKPAKIDNDLLIAFLTSGSENGDAYGVNGFGTGRMPAWGAVLDQEDIELIVQFLRGGNLDGREG